MEDIHLFIDHLFRLAIELLAVYNFGEMSV